MIPLTKIEALKEYIQVFNNIAKRLNKGKYEYKYEYQNPYCKFYIIIPLDTIIQFNAYYPNLSFEKTYINIYPQENRIMLCYKSQNMSIILDLRPIPNEFKPENLKDTLEKILDLDRFILWKIKQLINKN